MVNEHLFGMYITERDCGIVKRFTMTNRERRKGAPYTRINGEWYIDNDGILRQFKKSDTKGDNIQSVKRTFARLRDIINTNITEPGNVLFITFTYDPQKLKLPLDLKKVGRDMDWTFTKMKKSLPHFERIYTVERQGNGNWHTHCLFFFDETAPFIPQEQLETFWKHGFVKISKRFDDHSIHNVGAYVCADLTYSEDRNEHGQIKNERLMRYPSGSHLFRCSRGIRRPEVRSIEPFDYLDYVNSDGVHMISSSDHVHDFGGFCRFRYEDWFDENAV